MAEEAQDAPTRFVGRMRGAGVNDAEQIALEGELDRFVEAHDLAVVVPLAAGDPKHVAVMP